MRMKSNSLQVEEKEMEVEQTAFKTTPVVSKQQETRKPKMTLHTFVNSNYFYL